VSSNAIDAALRRETVDDARGMRVGCADRSEHADLSASSPASSKIFASSKPPAMACPPLA